MECKEYSVLFFTDGVSDDGHTFGCSAVDFASHGAQASGGVSRAVWAVCPRGVVTGGAYEETLGRVRALFAEGFKPDAAIAVFARNEGIENFLSDFSRLVGSIPVSGGGASPLADGSPARLVPAFQDVGILLIKDERYTWSSDWQNFHDDTGGRVNVRLADTRTVLSVQDVPAREWYAAQAEKYGSPENCCEIVALSGEEGYNLHLSPDGENALRAGTNVPAGGALAVRVLNSRRFERDIAEYCARPGLLVFGCAGLRGRITASIPVGADSLVGFFHGEVINAGGTGRFSNLVMSQLCARKSL